MHHLDFASLLGVLVIMLVVARLLGALCQWIGQPAVLGELVAGVVLGRSLVGVVDPEQPVLHAFAELGVIILLFEIGLESDLQQLLRVGSASIAVAVVGVIVPFLLGYGTCHFLGLDNLPAVVAGAAMTATSIGITARVLADLGRLQDVESQIVLGAAILDDVIGLIILTVVTQLTEGVAITPGGVARITAIAFVFLAVTFLLGRWLVPIVLRGVGIVALPGTLHIAGLLLAFALAWLASRVGSAMIVGAFAAGLLLAATPRAEEIRHGVVGVGHFFVPLFFVSVGASVEMQTLNPANAANRPALWAGIVLLITAIIGKWIAGYAPFWFRGRKTVIGVAMIPRGEVGLIFAQRGLLTGVFNASIFSAVTVVVLLTTLLTPPLLRFLLPRSPERAPASAEDIQETITESR